MTRVVFEVQILNLDQKYFFLNLARAENRWSNVDDTSKETGNKFDWATAF